MVKTQLESITEIISKLELSISKDTAALNSCDPADPKVHLLKTEIDRMNQRLEFFQKEQQAIIASGKTIYMFEFGTDDHIRQSFQDDDVRWKVDSTFIKYTQRILESDKTPAKKIKMMENLMKVYTDLVESISGT
ncbi:hypothetical protein EJP82_26750 [Paenibacillus anaericanus]|uniref:Uncharacterized protein n=1 Tax=Paenibacillus anaericanus TaxID=170367 RepID=A0A3S1BZY2_9BACL|nr:hypothetical protein [Paenibacillus anaericanus]RUT38715.1 hypothetical protein EJP82_26750 [Paenibacillus anaericanus]